MRVICLVPSITETLISCGVNVVGRTRFCIHPQERVKTIRRVGGTKDINWGKCAEVKPDLVIFDREENLKEMADACPYPYHTLHITAVSNIGDELIKLAGVLNNNSVAEIARRWSTLSEIAPTPKSLNEIPGMIDWWRPPVNQTQFIYLIWFEPWMAIGDNTFIQSVLDKLGLEEMRIDIGQKYPQIELDTLDPETTTLLFSNEPFPFHRKKDEMMELGYSCGLIDGEKYSWYGIRSLEFLEKTIA